MELLVLRFYSLKYDSYKAASNATDAIDEIIDLKSGQASVPQIVNIFCWITVDGKAHRVCNDLNVPIKKAKSLAKFIKNRTINNIPTDSFQVKLNDLR